MQTVLKIKNHTLSVWSGYSASVARAMPFGYCKNLKRNIAHLHTKKDTLQRLEADLHE